MFDYCVIGAGIVGLSTAYALIRKYPQASILILEKEKSVGLHQTSHNSGVIHAGIYYAPGSLKAKLCQKGLIATKAFCDEHGIRYEGCGKLIVATNPVEEKRLQDLYDRAESNGTKVELLSEGALKERQPNITGTLAVFSPDTGIVDYLRIAECLSEIIEKHSQITANEEVVAIQEKSEFVEIMTASQSFKAKKLVACAGLQADRIAEISGIQLDCKIVPFRGEYFQLPSSKNDIVQHLIYPVPDPRLPFLGVHLTRTMNGSVIVGPNAVLGWAREKYEKFSFNRLDAISFLRFSGFWKLIWKNRSHVISELKNSLLKRYYLEECQKYCPSLIIDDLLPHKAGIRAQVISKQGQAIHDFLIEKTGRMLHVLNAPSPAATSSLPIAEMIVEELQS